MVMEVKLQSTSKMLHKRDGSGLRILHSRALGQADVVIFDIFDDDPVHLRRQFAIGGAPEPERHGKRQDPLAIWSDGQYIVDQMGRGFDHSLPAA